MTVTTALRAVLVALAVLAGYMVWIAISGLGGTYSTCESPVIVEVLNGCGVRGIAEEVAGGLRDEGFDVLFLGNAEDFEYSRTLVVDRCGDRSKALAVRAALGGGRVIHQVGEAFFVDVTVIVGSDLATRLRHVEEPCSAE